MKATTIGGFARAGGVGVETIRYYQRRGLLETPERARGGIRYYSWGTVGRFYNPLNPGDYLMSLSGLAFKKEADNDGLVGRCASHFGQVIRDDYPMNHFHSINQILGLVGPDATPVTLYVEHARRLKQAGL